MFCMTTIFHIFRILESFRVCFVYNEIKYCYIRYAPAFLAAYTPQYMASIGVGVRSGLLSPF